MCVCLCESVYKCVYIVHVCVLRERREGRRRERERERMESHSPCIGYRYVFHPLMWSGDDA